MSSEINMSKLVNEIKQKGKFLTSDDIKSMSGNSSKEFVEHMKSCNNDDCEIHSTLDEKQKESLLKGFQLGNKYGNMHPGFEF